MVNSSWWGEKQKVSRAAELKRRARAKLLVVGAGERGGAWGGGMMKKLGWKGVREDL